MSRGLPRREIRLNRIPRRGLGTPKSFQVLVSRGVPRREMRLNRILRRGGSGPRKVFKFWSGSDPQIRCQTVFLIPSENRGVPSEQEAATVADTVAVFMVFTFWNREVFKVFKFGPGSDPQTRCQTQGVQTRGQFSRFSRFSRFSPFDNDIHYKWISTLDQLMTIGGMAQQQRV